MVRLCTSRKKYTGPRHQGTAFHKDVCIEYAKLRRRNQVGRGRGGGGNSTAAGRPPSPPPPQRKRGHRPPPPPPLRKPPRKWRKPPPSYDDIIHYRHLSTAVDSYADTDTTALYAGKGYLTFVLLKVLLDTKEPHGRCLRKARDLIEKDVDMFAKYIEQMPKIITSNPTTMIRAMELFKNKNSAERIVNVFAKYVENMPKRITSDPTTMIRAMELLNNKNSAERILSASVESVIFSRCGDIIYSREFLKHAIIKDFGSDCRVSMTGFIVERSKIVDMVDTSALVCLRNELTKDKHNLLLLQMKHHGQSLKDYQIVGGLKDIEIIKAAIKQDPKALKSLSRKLCELNMKGYRMSVTELNDILDLANGAFVKGGKPKGGKPDPLINFYLGQNYTRSTRHYNH